MLLLPGTVEDAATTYTAQVAAQAVIVIAFLASVPNRILEMFVITTSKLF
jgi:hypothetical protein